VSVTSALYAAFYGSQFLATALTLYTRDPWFTARRRLRTAVIVVIGLAVAVPFGYWLAAGFCVATLALLLGDWWKRGGKRVAKLIAGLLEKVRDAGSPAPEGIRA